MTQVWPSGARGLGSLQVADFDFCWCCFCLYSSCCRSLLQKRVKKQKRPWSSREKQTFHFLPCQSVQSALTNFWRFTFTTLVSPLHQQPWQRTHVCIALTGADIAGGARAHGTHVVHRCLNNRSQDGPGAAVGAISCSGLGWWGLGVWFLSGAAEREVGEATKPLETLRGWTERSREDNYVARKLWCWSMWLDVSLSCMSLSFGFLYSLCLPILMPKLIWIFKTITTVHEYGVQFVFQYSHLPLFYQKKFFSAVDKYSKAKTSQYWIANIALCLLDV